MIELSHQQIIQRYQNLPRPIQDVIFSEKSSDTIRKTCILREAEKYIAVIAKLTGRVLLGYLRPELFASEIQKETGVEELKAQHVAHDIDMEIFSEVRLELKKLYPPTMQTPNVQVQGFARGAQPAPAAPVAKPKYVISIPEKYQNKSFPGIAMQPVTAVQQKQDAISIPVTPTTPPPAPVIAPTASPLPASQQPAVDSGRAESAPVIMPKQEVKTPEMQKPKEAPAVLPTPAPALPVNAPEKKQEQTKIDVSGLSVTVLQNPPEAVSAPNPAQTQKTTPPAAPNLSGKQAQPGVKIAQTVEPAGVKMDPVVPLPTFIGSRFQQQQSSESSAKDSEQKMKDLAAKFATSSTAQPKPPQESAYKEHV